MDSPPRFQILIKIPSGLCRILVRVGRLEKAYYTMQGYYYCVFDINYKLHQLYL